MQMCIGKVSVPLTALVRRRRFPRSRVDVALHAISVHSVCGVCVPIRVRGRRAVAVLREASRPNRLIYSHRLVETLEKAGSVESTHKVLYRNCTDQPLPHV